MKAQVWKNEALGAGMEYKDIPDDLKKYLKNIELN
jgi:hypothetical protein